MIEQTIVVCSKCKADLFYIPSNYKMATKVICIKCGDSKKKKVRKKGHIQTAASSYARMRGGVRKDIHPTYYFRSSWEANIARVFEYIGKKWIFEEEKFEFPRFDPSTGKGYKNKPYSYLMDFEIKRSKGMKNPPMEFKSGYYEVKGQFKATSRNKMRRFKKFYPEQAKKTTIIIASKKDKVAVEFCQKNGYSFMCYDEITEVFAPLIPTWE